MAEKLSPQDTQEGVAERGEDGELIAESHEVDLPNGKTVEIDTKPLTTGLLNELAHLDEALAELKPSAIHSVFQKVYESEALLNMSEREIRDTRSEYLDAYLKPVDEATGDGYETGDSEGNPADMSRQERAEKMR